MDHQRTLIWIYLFICRHYRGRLAAVAQRQSNNSDPDFTDEEVLTIYLFGLFKKRTTISEIHEYVLDLPASTSTCWTIFGLVSESALVSEL